MKKLKKLLFIFLLVILILFASVLVYANLSTYQATNDANLIIEDTQKENNVYVFKADNPIANIIFYPGGFVDPKAYSLLLNGLKNEGFNVYLIDMPLNLAILNVNAAKNVIEKYESNLKWYIGGHSLGGASASLFVENYPDLIDGIYFLGAYSVDSVDLLSLGIKTTYIYGSNDLVLNIENIESQINLLPSLDDVHVIDGGNHAFFGNYGDQKKDGVATITRESQQQLTITILKNWILE
jgi:pimeloyl-ACP methyl ester carboxylesterase